jgi:NTP pyrophosphatase (non-canonical NTP hydrolase)
MKELVQKLRDFAKERDWDQFHSPKNLSMALSVEIAEIVEHFQWATEKESFELNPDKLEKVKDEIGDILIYLVRLADKLGIDPIEAAKEKLEKNKQKYPVDKVKGKANKYTDY